MSPTTSVNDSRFLSLLIVGTFNTRELFLISFDPLTHTLCLKDAICAYGNHSWLALDKSRISLVATCWTEPPSIASYRIRKENENCIGLQFQNSVEIKNRSGYVTMHPKMATRLYSAGGSSGETIAVDRASGRLGAILQEVNYITGSVQITKDGQSILPSPVSTGEKLNQTPHRKEISQSMNNVLDFGGLRHGAHSADFSPNGDMLYVPDIGRNCIWVHDVDENGLLHNARKTKSPRINDGPRHVCPHPNGEVVYVLQEHSNTVDVFLVRAAKIRRKSSSLTPLEWIQRVRIIPSHLNEKQFWADEVRTVAGLPSDGEWPEYLVASTRGLESTTNGYVSLFRLKKSGLIDIPQPQIASSFSNNSHHQTCKNTEGQDIQGVSKAAWIDIWQTPTCGGWANAVEPSYKVFDKVKQSFTGQYIALTDSEEGLVIMLGIQIVNNGREDGNPKLVEVARLSLGKTEEGHTRQAATAVWL